MTTRVSRAECLPVVVGGIGGGSLGAKIAKALRVAGGNRMLDANTSVTPYCYSAPLTDLTSPIRVDRYANRFPVARRANRVCRWWCLAASSRCCCR